jgi:hypothetical protein
MLSLLLLAFAFLAPQDHHAMNQRGEMVMGFDQDKTAHHFYLYPDGGAIDIQVKDAADTKNRDAIRSHLPHIASMFESGDFNAPMLVHDTKKVPGTTVLTQHKEHVRYTYVETPIGGRVNIMTTDKTAVAALHAFLRYQITEHKTGDDGTVSARP